MDLPRRRDQLGVARRAPRGGRGTAGGRSGGSPPTDLPPGGGARRDVDRHPSDLDRSAPLPARSRGHHRRRRRPRRGTRRSARTVAIRAHGGDQGARRRAGHVAEGLPRTADVRRPAHARPLADYCEWLYTPSVPRCLFRRGSHAARVPALRALLAARASPFGARRERGRGAVGARSARRACRGAVGHPPRAPAGLECGAER
mmetsp:Transcript_45800/g.127186  ORF Transcript_45800/g.127186 Transcript_45800/m.127186 type:complete len:202 (+) Transcript_45800:420-1025(+)